MQFIQDRLELLKRRIRKAVDNTMDNVYRGSLFWVLLITLVWLAIFLYILFYYYYVPAQSYTRPVHLQLKKCDEPNIENCPFPSAYVKLTKKHHILAVGQAYRFTVSLDVPESPINKGLGMFMVCVQLKDANGYLSSHSCRSSLLHYSSEVLQTICLILFSPFYVFGAFEEKQSLIFELYSDYEEDQLHQVTDVYVEVQAREIEIYSATLEIEARLSGLRYMMYNWPITSGIIGISLNVFIILLIVAMSLYSRYSVDTEKISARIIRTIDEKKKISQIKASNGDVIKDSADAFDKEDVDQLKEFSLPTLKDELNNNDYIDFN